MTLRRLTALALLAGLLVVPLAPAGPAVAADNGLALTPPMGFNNWNSTRCRAEFNEAMIKGMADIFVNSGLKAAGYQYINIDDCWAERYRNAAGDLVPHRTRFPNGIKAVADYVHSKGLKFGIYSSAGDLTCGAFYDNSGQPGSLNYEQRDANQWASWGVDLVKYDNCGNHGGLSAQTRYTRMRDALAATGRPILYSICEWGENQPWTWAGSLGNTWRTTQDTFDNWPSVTSHLHANEKLAAYAKPGAWNDPDMLQVGNGGMNAAQYQSQFSLWAMMAAPLLISTDLRVASTTTLSLLKNTDIIAVDQDPLGRQATIVAPGIYSKPLANGDRAVALFNESGTAKTISTTATAVGIGGSSSYSMKDLWSKATSTNTTGTFSATVPAYTTVVYRITPGTTTTPPPGTSQLSDLSWTSATNGWGPVEKNRSNGENAAGDGRTLTIAGTTYTKGLGTHAASEITYHLGGRCSTLTVDVGLDDETGTNGSVTFQIYRDTTKVADSGALIGTSPVAKLTANLTGGQQLRLVANGGASISYDHADWANPQLTCAA